MTINRALEEVAKFYQPGCIAYYGKQNPDPWQANNEMLEAAALTLDPERIKRAGKQFVARAKALVAQFKAAVPQKLPVAPVDAFMLGFADGRAEAVMSLEDDLCYLCSSDEQVQVEMIPGEGYETRVVCAGCIQTRREQSRQSKKSPLPTEKKIARTETVGHSRTHRSPSNGNFDPDAY